MKYVKNILICLLMVSLAFFACSDDQDDCISTIGPVVTESRTVSDFHSISLNGVGKVNLTQDNQQKLTIKSHENILDIISTKVSNNILYIEMDKCVAGKINTLDFNISIPEIKFLEVNGVGNFEGQNAFDLDDLMLDINGVGNISLFGHCDNLFISSTGVGNVYAFDMRAKNSEIAISGSGNAEVFVTHNLKVLISGSGNVYYKGSPNVSSTIHGTGIIISAD